MIEFPCSCGGEQDHPYSQWCSAAPIDHGLDIVNLTPHAVTVLADDGGIIATFQPSGTVLRLDTQEVSGVHGFDNALDSAGIPNETIVWGSLGEQPERRPNVRYIVSLPCLLAQPRIDYLVPFDEVRDDTGRIIGCRLLASSAHA